MDSIKKVTAKKAGSKKDIREALEKKLEAAFETLKTELGEKKFKQRIKKAVKLFTHGNKKQDDKKAAKIKPAAEKPDAEKKVKKAAKPAAKKAIVKKAAPKKVKAKKTAEL